MKRTQKLCLIAIIASVYVSIGIIFQSLSFSGIQVRLSDALYPLIGVLGIPALVGTFLGHLIFNFYGVGIGIGLGLFDIVAPLICLIPKFAIYRWGYKAVPFHVIFIVLWVAFALNSLYNIPFLLSCLTIGIGECIVEIVIGIPLAKLISKNIRYLYTRFGGSV